MHDVAEFLFEETGGYCLTAKQGNKIYLQTEIYFPPYPIKHECLKKCEALNKTTGESECKS